jgi:hypothetical protein
MLLDPILDEPSSEFENSQNEKYRKKTVNQYLARKNSTKYESRHYRQLEIHFGPRRMRALLRRLQIPTEVTVLVIGGYTGHFARALQNLGMRVIFTDPLREWVSEARKSGLEAHQFRAQGIPGRLLERAQLIATFECYYSFNILNLYNALRFLSRDYGILFVESESTRRDIRRDFRSQSAELTDFFLPFETVYSVAIATRKNDDLLFHHYHASNLRSRQRILIDAEVMKAVHDNLPTKSTITTDSLLSIPNIAIPGKASLAQSLKRIRELYRLDLVERGFDRQEIREELSEEGVLIGSKTFLFEYGRRTK